MIPPHIQDFLRTSITSVWALDLLCLLRSTGPRVWSSSELSSELRASIPLVEEILESFVRSSLVRLSASGRYSFDPADTRTASVISDVAKLYGERPVAVMKEIIRAPNEKIHTFVDAFRLKRE